jgi:hypothetical protein
MEQHVQMNKEELSLILIIFKYNEI